MASPAYVPRLVTTGWGRALMATPIIGHAVGAFANAYAGIVGAELKKCECSPRPQMLRPRPAPLSPPPFPGGAPAVAGVSAAR